MSAPTTRTVTVLDATGNRFVVADRYREDASAADERPAARELEEVARLGCDGLLVLGRSPRGADARMVLWNRDGSRARFCGNGLRCIAKLALERGHVRGPELLVETDSGPRHVRAETVDGRVARAAAEMGSVHVAGALAVDLPGASPTAHVVDVGNPHLVLFVEDVERVPLAAWARVLERHDAFPDGVNVECVEPTAAGLRLRVHERGVGETRSCGSGVTAAAVVAEALGHTLPLEVTTPGGVLRVEREPGAAGTRLWTSGPVRELGPDTARGA